MSRNEGTSMVYSQDESYSGDLPVAPVGYTQTHLDDEQGPSVSHEVVASYVADAARSVRGVVDLRTSTWKGLSSRMRETHSGGVVVKESEPGTVQVEIHARVAWGSVIPELANQVDAAVRQQVLALLNIDLSSVTLFVDEIAGPMEAVAPQES
jgi:uncharacterized alkaline shock family protein YloU